MLTLEWRLDCSTFNINLFCAVLFKQPWVFSRTRKQIARFSRFGSVGLSLLQLITFKINCVLTSIYVLQCSAKYTPHVKKWKRFLLLTWSMRPLIHSFFSQVLPFHWISPCLPGLTSWSSMHLSRWISNIRSFNILLTMCCWVYMVFQVQCQSVK